MDQWTRNIFQVAWVHQATNERPQYTYIYIQSMFVCVSVCVNVYTLRSFGHCGDIVMLLCTRDSIIDNKTKSIAFNHFCSNRSMRIENEKGHHHILFFIEDLSCSCILWSLLMDFDFRPFAYIRIHLHIKSLPYMRSHSSSCTTTTIEKRNFIHDFGSLFSSSLPSSTRRVVQYFRVEFLYPLD